jgi:hypothetical protein
MIYIICFIKRQGKCTFIDPQQVKEYSIEEFTNFAVRFGLISIEVLLEKIVNLNYFNFI